MMCLFMVLNQRVPGSNPGGGTTNTTCTGMQGDTKNCTGAFLCPDTSTPPTQGETAPTCTEWHPKEPAPSAERAQNLDPDLKKLTELWPFLPEKVRASIIMLVKATVEIIVKSV